MKNFLPYNKTLKQYSRDLRNHSTQGEILLWKKLRGRSFMGYQFLRQKPLDNYIVDFYCQALKLVVEVDGKYHNDPEVYRKDLTREEVLKSYDLTVLRFPEMMVRNAMDDVLKAMEVYVLGYQVAHPDCLKHNKRRRNPPKN